MTNEASRDENPGTQTQAGEPDTQTDVSPGSWREQAIARSLDSARTRAENRVQRFIDAAMELMADGSGKEFTVQEVVARSGQSLRSFYQYFGGKHELLLALFEESIRSTAERLQAVVDAEDDPGERLRAFVVEYYRVCRPAPSGPTSKPGPPSSPVMVEFAQQLLTSHPAEAAGAFLPLVTLFERVLDDAAEAGVVRAGLDRSRIAGIVLEAIMFNAFSATISGTRVPADGDADAAKLWDLLMFGLSAEPTTERSPS